MIFTTSWDDGHPLDLRIAELLAEHGLRGSFYVPVERKQRGGRMDSADLRRLRNLGMEVGAHTVSHPDLTTAPDAFSQLVDGKRYLEDLIGEKITAFAYPFGRFNSRVVRLVKQAGYRLARTTVSFSTRRRFEPCKMPTTFQFVRHRPGIHIRQAVREWNLNGLTTWCWRWQCETDLRRLARLAIEDARRSNGVVHLWGHSWEIDSHQLWGLLKEVLHETQQQPDVTSLTNSETVGALYQ